jgi:nucleoside-diphosphate-sugar epimerase
MRVFVTGASGHTGSHVVSELIAAGHEVTGLARSDTAAAAVSALGAKVRRGDLDDLGGLREAAADSDGVVHVAFNRDQMQSGQIAAVVAADLAAVHAFGEALAGTGKPLVAASSIGAPGNLGRPVTEEDAAVPSGEEHRGTLRGRNNVEIAVVGFAERGVRSSVVRLPPISHSTRDRNGFLMQLIAIAKEKGFAGYPGDGANRWTAVHTLDVASLFRLALENAPAGTRWHAIGDEGIPFREIAQSIGGHLGLRAESVPADRLPAHFGGFLAIPVSLDVPASRLITRRTLGWEQVHPGLLADFDNGHYFATPSATN